MYLAGAELIVGTLVYSIYFLFSSIGGAHVQIHQMGWHQQNW